MNSDTAIGIDLGTSYSCAAVIVDGRPMVIPNDRGERTHASVVSFTDESIIVGNEAKRRIITNSRNTVYSVKRLLGRYYFSDEVKKAQAVMPYEIVEGPSNTVRIRIQEKDYSTPEISALVLGELKIIAQKYLGFPVKKAVVTVPAFFNDNQRQATREAGRIAGLDVLQILNEPTAAALAFGFKGIEKQKVAIYDLGGGTFDVSILEIGESGVYQVLATMGDTYLGGDDFDYRIMDCLADVFMSRHGKDLRTDSICLQILKEASEQAKIDIATYGRADIVLEGISKNEKGMPLDLEMTIDGSDFNRMVMDLIQRTFKVCDGALQSAGLKADELDTVIIVGGPSRLPVIQYSVRHYFGKEPLTSINPDEIVALGAAIQADVVARKTPQHILHDITPFSLKIATMGGMTETIIEKNSPIPVKKSRVFTTNRDYQESLSLKVLQGESEKEEDCELLGNFEFSGFQKAGKGEVLIDVSFEIDADGIVNVTASDRNTGNLSSIRVNLTRASPTTPV